MSIAHEISWSLFSHKGQACWNCHIISEAPLVCGGCSARHGWLGKVVLFWRTEMTRFLAPSRWWAQKVQRQLPYVLPRLRPRQWCTPTVGPTSEYISLCTNRRIIFFFTRQSPNSWHEVYIREVRKSGTKQIKYTGEHWLGGRGELWRACSGHDERNHQG